MSALLMNRDFFDSLFPVGTFDFEKPPRNELIADKTYRNKEGVEYHICTPGVAKEDLHVTVEKGVLSVKAERRYEGKVVNAYTKYVNLPDISDPSRITSKYNNGLLCVSVPFKTKNDDSLRIVVD
jgi:HSP20 family molecular chaperone IbpA